MEIYLPIADMSVQWIVILGMGLGVGFLSGLFGVGGGFLLTPLLVFYGIPSGVAVATTLSHITASSMSGAIAQWKKRAIDFKMAGVMMLGGLFGTSAGVWLFAIMRRAGQMDLVVSLTYVPMLGIIGGIMLDESIKTLRAQARGNAPARIYPVNHVWIHGLPFKARFRQSRLYISVIPPLVIGTSLVQIIGVAVITTVLQATNNYAVDIVLAAILIIGGVIGAQFGVRAGAKLRGEQLRLLLALLVLAVAARLLWGLLVPPSDVYSLAGM